MNWLDGKPPAGLEWEMVPTPDQADVIMDLRVPRWLAARGAKLSLLIRSNDQPRRLKVAIPSGARDGLCMRIREAGRATSISIAG